MSGLWYAENILKAHVFPYYEAIRRNNPSCRVYLVQDNVYLHGLGLRYCALEIEEKGILLAPHLPNSPDLHPIERCFGCLEGFLGDYEVDSSSKAAKQVAKDHVQWIWQRDQEMRRFMEEHLDPEYFVEVADKCLDHDGNNNFTA
jgi:hypothetical protein